MLTRILAALTFAGSGVAALMGAGMFQRVAIVALMIGVVLDYRELRRDANPSAEKLLLWVGLAVLIFAW